MPGQGADHAARRLADQQRGIGDEVALHLIFGYFALLDHRFGDHLRAGRVGFQHRHGQGRQGNAAQLDILRSGDFDDRAEAFGGGLFGLALGEGGGGRDRQQGREGVVREFHEDWS